jgi:hypothetical protein
MLKSRLISFVLVLSTFSVTIRASTQEINQPSSDGVVTHSVQLEAQGPATGAEPLPASLTTASSPLPDAPLPSRKVSLAALAFAGQQQGRPSSSHPNSNRQKNIVLGVIITAGIICAIIIATQRDWPFSLLGIRRIYRRKRKSGYFTKTRLHGISGSLPDWGQTRRNPCQKPGRFAGG